MAVRPVFFATCTEGLVKEVKIDFKWYPGLSISQKQKSIDALHLAVEVKFHDRKLLEISSKSKSDLGVKLSAFNLCFTTIKHNKCYSVESAFQASKVFENGGPYIDLLDKSSRDAKKDLRIRNSGRLLKFKFCGQEWPLNPPSIFYDWLYINALNKNSDLARDIIHYDGFTDIEFNPEKSINCQARSAAIYTSLYKIGVLDAALKSKEEFIQIYLGKKAESEIKFIQPSLL